MLPPTGFAEDPTKGCLQSTNFLINTNDDDEIYRYIYDDESCA